MNAARWFRLAAILVTLTGLGVPAKALTIKVVDSDGKPVRGFRYLVELDTTIRPTLNTHDPNSLSLNIHRTYAPVMASGHTNGSSASARVSAKDRYYVSVLPDGGYTLSGAPAASGNATVTVTVHKCPVPPAQISVYVFEDNQPLNNAPDIPTEKSLPGFSIVVYDQLGQVSQDAYGNMLGTTYVTEADGSFQLDENGAPVVDMPGTGELLTDANGEVLIKNIHPGKYGIRAIPPRNGPTWIQTTTIEGTPGIDVWVGRGEPKLLNEFGLFSWHAFFGFVQPKTLAAGGGTGEITGQAVFIHSSKPPLAEGVNPGTPVRTAWVGLNNLSGADELVYAQACDAEGNFDIQNVPPGTYQLVIWDYNLDVIIDFRTVIVPPAGGLVALGPTPVFNWFGILKGSIFDDLNGNGFRDPGEPGIANEGLNLRRTDGSIYMSTISKADGSYEFEEVFPWFHWIVAEVGYTRHFSTGMTARIDDGGVLAPGADLVPQPQVDAAGAPIINPNTGDNLSRTQVGENPADVLLQAMLLYAGQTNIIDWGKRAHPVPTNGGIVGLAVYGITRAERDPRQGAAELWEPNIPRVQVALYRDANHDGIIDDANGDGKITEADVDNWPFGWRDGGRKGPEDISNNGTKAFNAGDAIQIVTTDSWDDNQPDAMGPVQVYNGQPIRSGAETLRTWNQVRPGLFDGGYAINSYFPGGATSGSAEVVGLPEGYYIVQASPPPGYEIIKEEDKNVDFGESYGPVKWPFSKPALTPLRTRPAVAQVLPPNGLDGNPPIPVGKLHLVPPELSLFGGVPCDFAGQWRPLCDHKAVYVSPGKNANCDFHLFTPVPKAARVYGMTFNDVLMEINPASPNASSNAGAAWIPIAFRDFRGVEVYRCYTDEYGRYNALVPSTFTINPPIPTGVSPNMLSVCLNDPGPIPDPKNPRRTIIDPQFDSRYSRPRYTLDFWPAKTTTCDTPILPIAGFNASSLAMDCEPADHTPAIFSVAGTRGGPYVMAVNEQITIVAVGNRTVRNPDFNPDLGGSPPTIVRDFGFGTTRGTVTVNGTPLTIVRWTASTVTAKVPAGVTTGQLMLTRGDNAKTTVIGLTLHVSPAAVARVRAGQSIQAAIDAAAPGTLIVIDPGTYKENLFLYKAVTLQGAGAYSTLIQAGPLSVEETAAWTARFTALTTGANPAGDLVTARNPVPDLALSQTPGIYVLGKQVGGYTIGSHPKIDGLEISLAEIGGGIYANAYCHYLEISNNIIESNQGNFGGGIRVGTPAMTDAEERVHVGSDNTHVYIHHNHVGENGAIDGGGGIALFAGSDDYRVTNNWVCGNFSLLYGGGIAHYGKSLNGLIAFNRIFNNEAFDEGGGIMIAGDLVPANAPAGTLSEGSGSVLVNSNIVQGNLGGDDGGGIRLLMPNGQDVVANPSTPGAWYTITILNNLIVNNSTADAGGGLSLDDAARVFVIHNTITANDSTATSVDAFGITPVLNNPPGQWLDPSTLPAGGFGAGIYSVPQPAGIAAHAHSTGLAAAFGAGFEQTFTNPVLSNNIIYQNRSFYWDYTLNGGSGGLKPNLPASEAVRYWDLGVYGTATPQVLNPTNCVLTSTTYTLPDTSVHNYDATNVSANPNFLSPYVNVYRTAAGGAALGLLINTTFTPLGLRGDYHLGAASGASNVAGAAVLFPELGSDIDGQVRPAGAGPDAGADEVNQ